MTVPTIKIIYIVETTDTANINDPGADARVNFVSGLEGLLQIQNVQSAVFRFSDTNSNITNGFVDDATPFTVQFPSSTGTTSDMGSVLQNAIDLARGDILIDSNAAQNTRYLFFLIAAQNPINTSSEMLSLVGELQELETEFGAADATLNTVLLDNPSSPDAAAEALLIDMAGAGGGLYQAVFPTVPGPGSSININFFDYSNLVQFMFFSSIRVTNLNAIPDSSGPIMTFHTDSDGDGLSDEQEISEFSTDPLNADTDGDCYEDGIEVASIGSDPNDGSDQTCLDDADDDKDGLPNSVEATLGTDPNRFDTDTDGVDDREEVLKRLDPFNNDMPADIDLDGSATSEELKLHTDPLNPPTGDSAVFLYNYSETLIEDDELSISCLEDLLVSNITIVPTLKPNESNTIRVQFMATPQNSKMQVQEMHRAIYETETTDVNPAIDIFISITDFLRVEQGASTL